MVRRSKEIYLFHQSKIGLVKYMNVESNVTGGGSFEKKSRIRQNRPPHQIFTHSNFSENIE